MPIKLKAARKKYLNKTILVILVLHNTRKLHKKVADYIKIPKLIVIKILQYISKNSNKSYYKIKYIE